MSADLLPSSSSYTQTFSSPHLYVGVSGIIGVGKSTLTKSLAQTLQWEAFFEPVKQNTYLELFYQDMEKYAFPMQINLLNKRFRQHQQAVWKDSSVIQDRTIYEDVIFAKMLEESKHISALDFKTYQELYVNMTNFLHRPDLIIFLHCKPEVALARIRKRSRACESTISLEYLESLQQGYEDWLQHISKQIPVLRIDWNEFQDTKTVIEKMNQVLRDHKKVICL